MKKLGADINVEREITDDQKEVMLQMLNSAGFKVFEIYLSNKFNREYRKLRKTRRSDESYERINGFLDGIEFVINCREDVHLVPQPSNEDGKGEENGSH
jgi:hypothetical protein